MSEFERNKFYNKKKFSNQRVSLNLIFTLKINLLHFNQSDSSFSSRFFNNKGNYSKDDSHSKDDKDDKSKNMKQPTILLKNRDRHEDRSVSPRRTTKENEPVIQIAQPTQGEGKLFFKFLNNVHLSYNF